MAERGDAGTSRRGTSAAAGPAPAGVWRRLDDTGLPALVARLAVGGVFIALGWAKLRDPVGFLKALRDYGMFPPSSPWLMNATAAALPAAEIACGLLLVLGLARRGTALFLGVLLAVFSTAIALRTGELAAAGSLAFCAVDFDCGCGSGVVNACGKLAENALLLVACGVLLVSRSRRFGLAFGRGADARAS